MSLLQSTVNSEGHTVSTFKCDACGEKFNTEDHAQEIIDMYMDPVHNLDFCDTCMRIREMYELGTIEQVL